MPAVVTSFNLAFRLKSCMFAMFRLLEYGGKKPTVFKAWYPPFEACHAPRSLPQNVSLEPALKSSQVVPAANAGRAPRPTRHDAAANSTAAPVTARILPDFFAISLSLKNVARGADCRITAPSDINDAVSI